MSRQGFKEQSHADNAPQAAVDDQPAQEQARDAGPSSAPSSSQDHRAEEVQEGGGAAPAGGAGTKPRQGAAGRRRQLGGETREKKRQEIYVLERDVEELERIVAQSHTTHLCLQSTGVHELLRQNRELVQDMCSANAALHSTLCTLKQQLENDGLTSDQTIVDMTAECSRLLRKVSDLREQAAWLGAVMMVMYDGLMFTHPALVSCAGDLPMACWLLAFIRSGCCNLSPDLSADLMNLLPSWKVFEDDLSMQICNWLQAMQDQGVAQVQKSLASWLGKPSAAPVDAHQVPGMLRGGDPSTLDRDAASAGTDDNRPFDLQTVLKSAPKPSSTAEPSELPSFMPPELQRCYNIMAKNKQFRYLALGLVEIKLAPLEFAHFLCTRVRLDDSIATLEECMAAAPTQRFTAPETSTALSGGLMRR